MCSDGLEDSINTLANRGQRPRQITGRLGRGERPVSGHGYVVSMRRQGHGLYRQRAVVAPHRDLELTESTDMLIDHEVRRGDLAQIRRDRVHQQVLHQNPRMPQQRLMTGRNDRPIYGQAQLPAGPPPPRRERIALPLTGRFGG